jgi:hypothetical protein
MTRIIHINNMTMGIHSTYHDHTCIDIGWFDAKDVQDFSAQWRPCI